MVRAMAGCVYYYASNLANIRVTDNISKGHCRLKIERLNQIQGAVTKLQSLRCDSS